MIWVLKNNLDEKGKVVRNYRKQEKHNKRGLNYALIILKTFT